MLFGTGDLYGGEHWYWREKNGQFIVVPQTFNNYSDSVSDCSYFQYRIIEGILNPLTRAIDIST